MARPWVLWASTSTATRGGVATYVRAIEQSGLWREWRVRHVATHRDGTAAAKIVVFLTGAARFTVRVSMRPAIVHLHTSAGASFRRKALLFWIGKLTGASVIVHIHASGFPDFYDRAAPLLRAMIRAVLTKADTVVVLGDVWAERLRSMVPAARIAVIPNAVATAQQVDQPTGEEPVRIVFLGRIGDHKGTFRLLDAWAMLANACESDWSRLAHLTVAGDGEVDRARSHVEHQGISDTVDIHDWLSPDEVGTLLGASHALVLPSRNEGQPMAVLEAMARGLCVVAGAVGTLPEMLSGGCGILVEPDNVSEIAAALDVVIHDRELRTRYGAAARARIAQRYEVDAVARQLDGLYRAVTGHDRDGAVDVSLIGQ